MTANPPGGLAQGGDGFTQAYADLIADNSIQFELRESESPAQAQLNWDSGLFDFLNSSAMTVAFWIIVALLAGFILFGLARRFLDGSRARQEGKASGEEQAFRPEPSVARQLLDEADRLAAQGRFAEAAHLLLFRSVEDIDSRRPGLVRPALTSRDIATLPELPARARVAFTHIAHAVERSLFGRRTLESADWEECRQAYERFAFVEGWG